MDTTKNEPAMKRITKLTNRPMTRYLEGFVKIYKQEVVSQFEILTVNNAEGVR
jgi:hypothetical protein